MKKLITIAALSLLSLSQTSQAEVTIMDYKKHKDDEAFKTYLSGYVEGLEWANRMMTRNKLQSLYCPPPTLDLTVDSSIPILDDFIQRSTNISADDYTEVILIFAMQDAFPCK